MLEQSLPTSLKLALTNYYTILPLIYYVYNNSQIKGFLSKILDSILEIWRPILHKDYLLHSLIKTINQSNIIFLYVPLFFITLKDQS